MGKHPKDIRDISTKALKDMLRSGRSDYGRGEIQTELRRRDRQRKQENRRKQEQVGPMFGPR